MNTTPPLLPETAFKPLSEAKLNSMISHALTHRQEGAAVTNNVIAFRRPWTATIGLGAMAASIMLAFMATPQYSGVLPDASTGTDIATSSDVSDLLLLESFGA